MLLVLLFIVPLVSAILSMVANASMSRNIALLGAFVTSLVATMVLIDYNHGEVQEINTLWMPTLHSYFHIKINSWNILFVMLNALSFLVVYAWSYSKNWDNPRAFFALMAISQAAMFGVFMSYDALLFYFFWELALIPVYFLCSRWGGKDSVKISFRFFIYTFLGSILMLIAIFFLYYRHGQSFEWTTWIGQSNTIVSSDQTWLFWFFFIGLAVKIPLFPLHAWQSDTYTIAPKPVLMILSAVMAKMGIFGMIHWMYYMFPSAVAEYQHVIVVLALVGILYASFIALVDGKLIRVLAFSSIAHLSLLVMAIFANPEMGVSAAIFQSISHAAVVLGLWMLVDKIVARYGTDDLAEIRGGLAKTSPLLALFFVFFAFANMGLPLTMSFIGEFQLFYSVYSYDMVLMLLAASSVIWSAAYMLRLNRKVLFGENADAGIISFDNTQITILSLLVVFLVYFGVYPHDMLALLSGVHDSIISLIN